MALEDLNPAVRVEEILDGADIEPATRLEYFMKKAANEVPKPAGSSDAGKVVTVNEDGDGYELTEAASGGAFIINVSGTPGSTLTPDKTYPELAEAVSGGAIPVVLLGGGSLVLEYSGKNGNVFKFERLSANTSGAAIEGFSYFLGEYDQGGFTVSSYSASL